MDLQYFIFHPTHKKVPSLIGAATKIKSGLCQETKKSSFNKLPVYVSGPFMGWDEFYIFYLKRSYSISKRERKNITGNGYEQFNYYFSI